MRIVGRCRTLFTFGLTAALALLSSVVALARSAEAEAAQPLAAPAKTETSAFVVETAPLGPYRAQAEGKLKVTLKAKEPFHINDKYPYRLKAGAPVDGIAYPRPTLQRGDGSFSRDTATFELPFVPARAGSFEVGGTFHLSVCSKDSCLVEKVPVAAAVQVP